MQLRVEQDLAERSLSLLDSRTAQWSFTARSGTYPASSIPSAVQLVDKEG